MSCVQPRHGGDRTREEAQNRVIRMEQSLGEAEETYKSDDLVARGNLNGLDVKDSTTGILGRCANSNTLPRHKWKLGRQKF